MQKAAKKLGAVTRLGAIVKTLTPEKSTIDIEVSTKGGVAALAATQAESELKSMEDEDMGIPLKNDPRFGKYFKMLKMGLSLDAVKHTLRRDGNEPSVLDLDPDGTGFFANPDFKNPDPSINKLMGSK